MHRRSFLGSLVGLCLAPLGLKLKAKEKEYPAFTIPFRTLPPGNLMIRGCKFPITWKSLGNRFPEASAIMNEAKVERGQSTDKLWEALLTKSGSQDLQ